MIESLLWYFAFTHCYSMLPSRPKKKWHQATNLEMLQATQFAYGHMICMKCIDNNITTGCDSDLVTTSKLSYTDSLCSKNNDDINDRTSESGSTKSESLNCKDNDMQSHKETYGKCNILEEGNVLLSRAKLSRLIEKTLSAFNVFADTKTSLNQCYEMHL